MDETLPEQLFFVVKEANGHSIWAGTREEMFKRMTQDGTLRLDRAPFRTRADAEARISDLLGKNQPASLKRSHQ